MKTVLVCLPTILLLAFSPAAQGQREMTELENRLKVMGHRNWIVVADMAYPQQANPAIETIYVGGDHVKLVDHVLKLIDEAPHVRPSIYLDAELPAVSEADAPGIEALRTQLTKSLGKRKQTSLPHEQIIERLDESADMFNVVIVKTDMTLPYTSVFIQLDCGYWSDEAEQRLREAMAREEEIGGLE